MENILFDAVEPGRVTPVKTDELLSLKEGCLCGVKGGLVSRDA